jgi:uncharacterized membrane protein
LGDPLKKSAKVFAKLGMQKTEQRNGILIYVASISRKFSVFGDEGIHTKVTQIFWNNLTANLSAKFKQDKKAEALAEGIIECGKQLSLYFPFERGDKNELSDSISY